MAQSLTTSEATEAWRAELGAILASQKATLEFERLLGVAGREESLSRELFSVRVVESALSQTPGSQESLCRATEHCVAVLNAQASSLYPFLDHESEAGDAGLERGNAQYPFQGWRRRECAGADSPG